MPSVQKAMISSGFAGRKSGTVGIFLSAMSSDGPHGEQMILICKATGQRLSNGKDNAKGQTGNKSDKAKGQIENITRCLNSAKMATG